MLEHFFIAQSEAADWAAIAKELSETIMHADVPETGFERMGFLYATDSLSENFGSIITFLRQTTHIENWFGTLGIGVCVTGKQYYNSQAAVVMVADFPEGSTRIQNPIQDSVDEISLETASWISMKSPPFAIIHGNPKCPSVPALIENLSTEMERLSGGMPGFIVGGLTGSRGRQYQLANQVSGDISEGNLSAVMFSPEIEVATNLSQGCTPVGNIHTVSDCIDNVIIGLDGTNALDVFRDDIGELLARDLNRVSGYVHAAFLVAGSDTGDYMVRNLIAIDPKQGWLAINGEVQSGDRLMFVRRDPESAKQDLIRMAGDLSKRLPSQPRGGIYFTCAGRGPAMFNGENEELKIIKDILGDFPLIGFFGQGEVSNNRLYSYTGILAIFL